MKKRWYIIFEFSDGSQKVGTAKGALNIHEAIFAVTDYNNDLRISKIISAVRR